MSGFETVLLAAALAGTAAETASTVVGLETKSKIARSNAKIEQAESAEEARVLQAEARKRTSTGRVRAGASGLSVDGSALDVIGAMQAEGEMAARNALHEGRVRYDNFRAKQKNAKRAKTGAVIAGVGRMASTLATSGVDFGGKADAAEAGV